jgi:hypothetical protein
MSLHTPWRDGLSRALSKLLDTSISTAGAPQTLLDLSSHRLVALDPLCRAQSWSLRWHCDSEEADWRLPWEEGDDAVEAYLFHQGCSANGYRRQRALHVARQRASASSLALILIRCDDWVDEVRSSAKRALQNRLSAQPAILFEHLELLARLGDRGRIAAGAWQRLILPALLAPEHGDRLWRALSSGTGLQTMFVAKLILDHWPARLHDLLHEAVGSRNPVFAGWALQRMQAAGFDLPEDVLAQGMLHRNPGVRARALRLRASRRDPALADIVRAALFDRFPSIRQLCAHLATSLGIDAMALWRNAVDAGREPQARHALTSLCERAQPCDAVRIVTWHAHPAGEVRRSVLSGLMRADPALAEPFLHRALRSTSVKDVRHALRLGELVPRFINREPLATAFAEAANANTAAVIVHAMRLLPPWDALECLMDGLQAAAADRIDAVRGGLAVWKGARIGRLAPARRDALLTRIDALQPRFPQIGWQRIRALVGEG